MGLKRRARVFVATAALAAVLSPTASVASMICSDDIRPADSAKAVRVLQSELMVAALACDAKHHYGNFVKRYSGDLKVHGRALQTHFHTEHGKKKGFAELNRFVTRMANKASGRMASLGSNFCSGALETYDHLLTGDGVELVSYSITYSNKIVAAEHGVEHTCGSDRLAVAPQQ